MSPRVLFVDDEPEMCDVIASSLGKCGYEITTQTSPHEAMALLGQQDFDVVITDMHMPRMNGLDLCADVVANRPDTPVIVVTAFGSLDVAIGAIRAGAYDFVTKPFDMDVLRLSLDRAVQHRFLRKEIARLRASAERVQSYDGLVGESAAMQKVYDMIARIAETDVSVLVSGESGTGKELVARAIHSRSSRHAGPFVAINCAAMPENLLESELFGHIKGAFTDAKQARAGLFVESSGGVIFLDEIGDLPATLQPKLLRALQDKKVRPVGGSNEVAFDARIVTSTNRDLEALVEERQFREDLYYRINVVRLPLPPLRARGNDILLLAQHFLDHYARTFKKTIGGFSAKVAARLLAYSWPGNVRELQNCIERAVALTRMTEIVMEDLPTQMLVPPSRLTEQNGAPVEPDGFLPLAEIERRHILRAMEIHQGNRGLAADALGIDRKTLYRRLRAYGFPKDET